MVKLKNASMTQKFFIVIEMNMWNFYEEWTKNGAFHFAS